MGSWSEELDESDEATLSGAYPGIVAGYPQCTKSMYRPGDWMLSFRVAEKGGACRVVEFEWMYVNEVIPWTDPDWSHLAVEFTGRRKGPVPFKLTDAARLAKALKHALE